MRRQPNGKAAADAIDWQEIAKSLDEQGYATTPPLLTQGECRETAALYPREEVFRSRVIMQRHAFGRGEYQYFRYPLPGVVEGWRRAIYPHLAPIANRWRERLNEEGRFPPSLAAYLERCHKADPLFQKVKPVTLFSSMKSFTFRLWDEQRQRMVGYAALARARSEMAGRKRL